MQQTRCRINDVLDVINASLIRHSTSLICHHVYRGILLIKIHKRRIKGPIYVTFVVVQYYRCSINRELVFLRDVNSLPCRAWRKFTRRAVTRKKNFPRASVVWRTRLCTDKFSKNLPSPKLRSAFSRYKPRV